MREKCEELLSIIQSLRKEDNTTASQLVEEYQDVINAHSELSKCFSESIESNVSSKQEVLWDCLLYSYQCEPNRLTKKERRNFTLGLFWMLLFEFEVAIIRDKRKIIYEIEVNNLNELEDFVHNRLDDLTYVLDGKSVCNSTINDKDFINKDTYKGIKKEALFYFGFNENTKNLQK